MATKAKQPVKKAPISTDYKKKVETHIAKRNQANPAKPTMNPVKSLNYFKTIVDQKSGLKVLIQAIPEDHRNINNGPCAVIIQTVFGNTHYLEHTEHGTLTRALEYITDYSQVQCARFCVTALQAAVQKIPLKFLLNESAHDKESKPILVDVKNTKCPVHFKAHLFGQ